MIAGDHDLIVEIPVPREQAAPVIVNQIMPIEGVQETRTLVAILFTGPDEEDLRPVLCLELTIPRGG
jgi:hypothetical protein